MIRKLILKIFVKLYLARNREINKLTEEQEFNKFLFRDKSAVEDILRSYLTRSTLTYWEATSEYERNIEKGTALAFKLLLDLHKAAEQSEKLEKIPEKKISSFKNLKNNLLVK